MVVAFYGTMYVMRPIEHHAILIEGPLAEGLSAAAEYSSDVFNIHTIGNPDYLVHSVDSFTVEDARELKRRAGQTPLGSHQTFVLTFERISHAAQNALLKLLEEPAPDTSIILVVPTARILLSTVRSRLAHLPKLQTLRASTEGRGFLALDPPARSKSIAHMVKEGDRVAARKLCDALELELYERDTRESRKALVEVAYVRKYVGDASSSLKMLLEHLTVTL